jgi:CspA family cold shock protein
VPRKRSSAVNVGTVKNINEKGFGFINRGEREKDLFFHASGMAEANTFDNLKEGDKVTFEVDNNFDRPRGVNVRPTL